MMASLTVRSVSLVARKIEKTMRPMLKMGMAIVPNTKPLVLTRVLYSRLIISQTLRRGVPPCHLPLVTHPVVRVCLHADPLFVNDEVLDHALEST